MDPSIAVAALETSPEGLLNDLRTFGFVFETLCMRDLRAYVESAGGSVSHYHDSNGLESFLPFLFNMVLEIPAMAVREKK